MDEGKQPHSTGICIYIYKLGVHILFYIHIISHHKEHQNGTVFFSYFITFKCHWNCTQMLCILSCISDIWKRNVTSEFLAHRLQAKKIPPQQNSSLVLYVTMETYSTIFLPRHPSQSISCKMNFTVLHSLVTPPIKHHGCLVVSRVTSHCVMHGGATPPPSCANIQLQRFHIVLEHETPGEHCCHDNLARG